MRERKRVSREPVEEKLKSVYEDIKFVCQGAKLMCKYCAVPIGELIVTSNTVSLQDKPWATEMDRNNGLNVQFKGVCMHPQFGLAKPPCIAAIQLGMWKNVSESIIQNYRALLKKSTIDCITGMSTIKIIHCGQKNIPKGLNNIAI